MYEIYAVYAALLARGTHFNEAALAHEQDEKEKMN